MAMKASDSSNSLAALNPDDPTCFICLEIENELAEPLVDSSLLRNCGCKFHVHPFCWNKWMESKSPYDCPICHKKSLTTPGPPTPYPIILQQGSCRESYVLLAIIATIGVAGGLIAFFTIRK